MAIDVGAAAIDRDNTFVGGYTSFDGTNPANATGTIDTVEAWTQSSPTDVTAATFFLVSGTTYQCRDSEYIGIVISGSKQTFTGLSISVQTSDLIGTHFTNGATAFEATASQPSGSSYYVSGEYKDAGDQASYTAYTKTFSLYGTGTEAGGGWANIAKVNGVASASISKVNGVAKASIAKISGVAV